MLGKSKNFTIICCISIITLLITYASMIIINVFTEDEVTTKEAVVGINPVILTQSRIAYQEPLTILLEQQENKDKEIAEEKPIEEIVENQEENKIEQMPIQLKQQEDNKQETSIDVIVENIIETVVEEVAKPEEKQELISTEYKGFATVGKIEIPQTGVDTPILDQVTVKGMENAPCLLYATGELNQNGNNLIVGHNYRNGTIFSDNKNLKLGDKIYVTTLDGQRIEYTIYNKFVTTAEDVSYIKRDTNNKPEITLSCCTDDDEYRIIILAKIED